jgi:dihydrofolate reductase
MTNSQKKLDDMNLSIIVAMTEKRVIGLNNSLPWHISADLKRFKQITMGHPIVMGRKTYDSIGRPLPGRTNIIITRNWGLKIAGCHVVNSINEAIKNYPCEEIFLIGGSSIYKEALPISNRIYMTLIREDFEGDTWFPEWKREEWAESERINVDDDRESKIRYSFLTLERKV